jgi:hypothetical protein
MRRTVHLLMRRRFGFASGSARSWAAMGGSARRRLPPGSTLTVARLVHVSNRTSGWSPRSGGPV